jgi:hypothetical protein
MSEDDDRFAVRPVFIGSEEPTHDWPNAQQLEEAGGGEPAGNRSADVSPDVPEPVRSTERLLSIAMSSKTVFCRRQSVKSR